MNQDYSQIVGKKLVNEDGTELRVHQIKQREDGPWVTYFITYPGAVPRKLVMPAGQFVGTYADILK